MGDTTDLGVFSANEARDRFMARLHALVPECFASLCSPEGLELAAAAQDGLVRAWLGETVPGHWDAQQALSAYIRRWQGDWHLVAVPEHVSRSGSRMESGVWSQATPLLTVNQWRKGSQRERQRAGDNGYSWIHRVADETLREYVIATKYDEPIPASFVELGRLDKPSLLFETNLHGQPVTIDLDAFPVARFLPSHMGWPFFGWNPRVESRHDARERLIKVATRLVDDALDAIEREKPSMSVPDKHLDWLVRFQVMGQSMNAIAREVGHKNHGRVGTDINQVAVLIGLEPRDGRQDRGRRRNNETTVDASK